MTPTQPRMMTDAELDRAIAEKVMGWKIYSRDETIPRESPCVYWSKHDNLCKDGAVWSPCEDRNAVALVLERIGELKLVQEFGAAFEEAYLQDLMNDCGPRWLGEFGRMLASTRIFMQAALKAVEGKR